MSDSKSSRKGEPLTERIFSRSVCSGSIDRSAHGRKYAGLSIRRPGFKSFQRAESPGRSTRTILGRDHHRDRDAGGRKDSPRQATSQNHWVYISQSGGLGENGETSQRIRSSNQILHNR